MFNQISFYDGLSKTKQRALERTLNEAVREAMNDETFRKVQRLSYGQHGPEEVYNIFFILSSFEFLNTANVLFTFKLLSIIIFIDLKKILQIGSRFGLHNRGTDRSNVKESDSIEEIGGKDLHKGLTNSGNTNEDLAALDRLITYLLSPTNSTNSNLDSWRRSHRASSRGYRQLRGTTVDTAETGGVGTTPL